MKYKRRIGLVLSVVLLFILVGCSKRAKNDTPVVITIDNSKIHMDEMMYYIYQAEVDGNEMEEKYQAFFGESYWDTTDDTGKTNRELEQSNIMEHAIKNDIFYQKACDAGYECSDNEMQEIINDATSLMEEWTDEQKLVMKITKERLIEILTKISIANAYDRDFRETLDVDEATVTSGIYEEDYEEYDVEYLYVPTVTFTQEYDMIPYSKVKKQSAYEQIKKNLEKAKHGINLADLLTEKEQEAGAECSEVTFIAGDEILGSEFEKAALKLSNGQISDSIVEEEDGYYIMKMINNDSKMDYQNAMTSAIENAREKAFSKAYKTIKKEYKIIIQEKIWNSIEIGTITWDENSKVEEKLFNNSYERSE
ncbi:MAG: peptidylprolyl isomerase [Velocimicrobium sp.]